MEAVGHAGTCLGILGKSKTKKSNLEILNLPKRLAAAVFFSIIIKRYYQN